MLAAFLHPDRSRPWIDGLDETQADLVAHAERIAALLDACGPRGGRVVLSCRRARAFVPGLLGAWLAGAMVELLPNVQPGTLDRVDADPGVAHVLHDVVARQTRSTRAIYVPDVIDAPAPASGAPTGRAWPGVAVCMTTSGTTEQPRSVSKTSAQLVAEIDALTTVIPTPRRLLATVPLSHFYGLLFGVLLPLRTGARVVSHEALLPADIAALIARASVDLMVSTPAHLRAMAAIHMPRGLHVVTSGARLPAELHMSLVSDLGWQVTDVLGSTETGGIAIRRRPMHGWTPLPGARVTAPDGQLVVESPWCDAGRAEIADQIDLRPDGSFHYLGRNTEVVKIAGKRAHAQAIEATVLAVPGVADAALVIHAAPGREPRVALAVVPTGAGSAPVAPVTRDAITAAIRHDFDAVFVPRIVKLVPALPRTERGKLDAAALRALLGLDAAAVDRIAARRIAPGHHAVHIPANLVFFQGHFDSLAVLPGAVLLERVVWPIVVAEWRDIAALLGIRRLRFRRPVYPDQQLAVTVIRDPGRDAGRVGFEVACAGAVVATGQLLVR